MMMNNIYCTENITRFEDNVRKDLMEYLQGRGVVDAHIPECTDLEEKWDTILHAYIADGAREFAGYPVVSLGWMMFIGMSMAWFWDLDWEGYRNRATIYEEMRDRRGYDYLDEVITGEILCLSDEDTQKTTDIVARCAARVYSALQHEHVEPGTTTAYGYYIAALHQLYLAGVAMELKTLGYHMTKL